MNEVKIYHQYNERQGTVDIMARCGDYGMRRSIPVRHVVDNDPRWYDASLANILYCFRAAGVLDDEWFEHEEQFKLTEKEKWERWLIEQILR